MRGRKALPVTREWVKFPHNFSLSPSLSQEDVREDVIPEMNLKIGQVLARKR